MKIIVEMNKEKRKRIGLLLGKILITLSIIALGLGCYILCSVGFNLYKAGCMGGLATMIIGIIFTTAIIALIYVILRTWKEIKEIKAK